MKAILAILLALVSTAAAAHPPAPRHMTWPTFLSDDGSKPPPPVQCWKLRAEIASTIGYISCKRA